MERWTVPMYTSEFLALADQAQSIAIICSQCKKVWDMGGMPEQEAIKLARYYGYKMTSSGPVCDTCLRERV